MDDLDDELDLRYHRDLKPDVYYRCPSSEVIHRPLHLELQLSRYSPWMVLCAMRSRNMQRA